MSEKKYYCLCGSNCKYETMTKEQIIAAIAEATGVIVTDVDAAFITKVKESNTDSDVSFWMGTKAQFNAIAPAVKANTFIARIDENGKLYICTDDDTETAYRNVLTTKQNKLAWATDADIDAMFDGSYVGAEDESPEGKYPAFPVVRGEGADSIVHNLSVPGGAGDDPTPRATGDSAIALGRYSTATGKNSVSLGYDTDATGEMSFAANGANNASGEYSAAFGGSNHANGSKSFAGGHANYADGENAFACGYSNKVTEGAKNGFVANTGNEVSAPNAAAFGTENKAAGDSSLAVGGNNEATGVRAFATGTRTKARGAFAFSGGTSTEANGNASFAIGARTKANGTFAFAGGNDTEADGNAGFAFGAGLKVTKDGQTAFGKYNAPADDLLFMYGVGTDDAHRKNGFAIKENAIVIGNTEITEAQLQQLLALLG